MDASGSRASWARRYPSLFRPHRHSWAGVSRDHVLELTLDLPPDDLVVNVRLVPTVDDRIVVCETAEGWRFLPGGSRERGEGIDDTARRELLEEAGCRIASDVTWFASFTVTGHDQPWRSWHPFPVSAWLVGTAEVRLTTTPTNPPDGEQIVGVYALVPSEARTYLAAFDNGGHADLVALAHDLGLLAGTTAT